MRILFLVRQLGYLSHFADVVSELAQRGHTVRVAVPSDEPARLPKGLIGHSSVSGTAGPARRRDQWGDLVEVVRSLRSYTRYWHPLLQSASKARSRSFRKLATELSAKDRMHLKSRCPHCQEWIRDEDLAGLVKAAVNGQGSRLGLLGEMIERSIPSDPSIEQFLRKERPDVMVVTPLVRLQSPLPDYVKSARNLRIPTVSPIWSWDNLSNKGLMHEAPDRVLVWNETQRREATDLHGVPKNRVEVTGAPRFDRFLRMTATQTREQFCRAFTCDPLQDIIAYLGSSKWIAPDEIAFVRCWVESLRGSGHHALMKATILLRPHPQQRDDWRHASFAGLGNVSVFDSEYVNASQQMFNGLHHASAAVGLNTSASIEAAITGTPGFTILAPEFQAGQSDTLHFHYLLEGNGGCVRQASTLEEHTAQLRALLSGEPEAVRDRTTGFVTDFVKGGHTSGTATARTVRAIEAAAGAL